MVDTGPIKTGVFSLTVGCLRAHVDRPGSIPGICGVAVEKIEGEAYRLIKR